MSLIVSLSHHVEDSYDNVKPKIECLHITAAMLLAEQVDAIHGLSPTDDFSGKNAVLS